MESIISSFDNYLNEVTSTNIYLVCHIHKVHYDHGIPLVRSMFLKVNSSTIYEN